MPGIAKLVCQGHSLRADNLKPILLVESLSTEHDVGMTVPWDYTPSCYTEAPSSHLSEKSYGAIKGLTGLGLLCFHRVSGMPVAAGETVP